MGEIRGKPKEQISYKIPSDILSKIDRLVELKEFNNRSDVLTTGMRFYFDNRDTPSQKDQLKEWLLSDDGEAWIKDLIRKVKDED
ncbi:MAG: ribbon-helix-helix domain-containing protein [Methanoregula sp.]|jgi:Arc/MetJ-type ribon-helix-helix transcriptional regulator|uniref:ribbon-helix-helix domain-containing protein n=1 Tax=Methanoregula sp. TaxID=2052170 RepID=UPI003D0FC8CD